MCSDRWLAEPMQAPNGVHLTRQGSGKPPPSIFKGSLAGTIYFSGYINQVHRHRTLDHPHQPSVQPLSCRLKYSVTCCIEPTTPSTGVASRPICFTNILTVGRRHLIGSCHQPRGSVPAGASASPSAWGSVGSSPMATTDTSVHRGVSCCRHRKNAQLITCITCLIYY